MDKVLFGGARDFSDMYIKEEPVVYDSEEMEDAGFDTQEYRQDVKIEINSDDSDVESIDGGEELEDNSSEFLPLILIQKIKKNNFYNRLNNYKSFFIKIVFLQLIAFVIRSMIASRCLLVKVHCILLLLMNG